MAKIEYQPFYKNSAALVIGVNHYQHVGKLEIARADAESIAKSLIEDLGFPKNRVTVLLDKKADSVREPGRRHTPWSRGGS